MQNVNLVRMSNFGRRTLSLATLAAASSIACASIDVKTDATERARSAIINGSTADAENSGIVNIGDGCTGTLLNNEYVLTATHCRISSGVGVRMGSQLAQVKQVWNKPGHDLTMLLLDRRIRMNGSWYGFQRQLRKERLAVGETVTCMGYGLNAYGAGQGTGFGTLRSAQFTAYYVDQNGSHFHPNAVGQIQSFGDSGGPCFDASGAAIGAMSFVNYTQNEAGDVISIDEAYVSRSDDLPTWAHALFGDTSPYFVDWVNATNSVPVGAVPTGSVTDSGTCYSCTAEASGGGAVNTHAGKLCKYDNRWSCFIGNGGTEQRHEAFRVLVGYSPIFAWSAMTAADPVPNDATRAGWIVDSGECYVCRWGNGNGDTHPGKLCRVDGRWSCFVGNGGAEQRHESYEVLHNRAETWKEVRTVDANGQVIAPDPTLAGAVPAGSLSDAGTCYACSVQLPGWSIENTHIGKLCKYRNIWTCFVGNGGVEQQYQSYRTLVGNAASYTWVSASSTSTPSSTAVWGGWTQTAGDCYVCRATAETSNTHVGKLCRENNRWSCFVGNGGIEQRYETYEVMLRR